LVSGSEVLAAMGRMGGLKPSEGFFAVIEGSRETARKGRPPKG